MWPKWTLDRGLLRFDCGKSRRKFPINSIKSGWFFALTNRDTTKSSDFVFVRVKLNFPPRFHFYLAVTNFQLVGSRINYLCFHTHHSVRITHPLLGHTTGSSLSILPPALRVRSIFLSLCLSIDYSPHSTILNYYSNLSIRIKLQTKDNLGL